MSGRKQHFIPQFLLRNFSTQSRGKAAQLTVYSRNRGVYVASTSDIAAQRDFYSDSDPDGALATLDDTITGYEGRLAEVLSNIRTREPGASIDPKAAAEAVTHLCIRGAHIRNSIQFGIENMLGELSDIAQSEKQFNAMMEAEKPLAAEIDKLIEERRADWPAGMSRRNIRRRLMAEARKTQPAQRALAGAFVTYLRSQTGTMTRNAHNKALTKAFVPGDRVASLSRFRWSTKSTNARELILSDCVAIARTANDYQPLIFSAKDVPVAVYLALSNDRLLVGTRDYEDSDLPEMFNEISASCSWDCFFASKRTEALEKLASRIGEHPRRLITAQTDAAFGAPA